MRTTIDIDDDVLGAAKELAALRGKTAGQMVSELLRKALQPPPAAARTTRNGVPLIQRRTGAPIMTTALVNQLRDDA